MLGRQTESLSQTYLSLLLLILKWEVGG